VPVKSGTALSTFRNWLLLLVEAAGVLLRLLVLGVGEWFVRCRTACVSDGFATDGRDGTGEDEAAGGDQTTVTDTE
jgi:hypothetical protein